MPPNGDSTKIAAMRGVEALGHYVTDNERLHTENARLHTDFAMMRERVDQVEARLAVALAERDHYMRFSTELVTNLNTIRMTIDEAVRAAKHVTYKPGAVVAPKQNVVDIDTKGIENLLKRLPVNGGDKDAVK